MPGGGYVFVSLFKAAPDTPGDVGVIGCIDGYRYLHRQQFAGAAGMCVSADGSKIFIGQKIGSVAAARPEALISGESASTGSARTTEAGGTGIVALTRDERFLVTSEERAGCLAVLDASAIDGDAGRDAVVGTIAMDLAPIAVVPSPCGRFIYATSQYSADPGTGKRGPGRVAAVTTEAFAARGSWGVPIPDAVVARVEVGNAVRLALSHVGAIAWVTLREENKVVALDTADLRRGISNVLASIATGPAPVGVALHGSGRYLLVTNSNRFKNSEGLRQTVSVIDTEAALGRRPAIVDRITVGAFPRELVPDDAGNTFLTNFDSGTVTVIS